MTLPSSAPQLVLALGPIQLWSGDPSGPSLLGFLISWLNFFSLPNSGTGRNKREKKQTKNTENEMPGQWGPCGSSQETPYRPRLNRESLATQGVMVSAVGLGPRALMGIGDVAVEHPEIKGHLLREVGAQQGQAPHYLTCPHTTLWGECYCLPPPPLQAHWFLSPSAHPLYSAVPSWRVWPPP